MIRMTSPRRMPIKSTSEVLGDLVVDQARGIFLVPSILIYWVQNCIIIHMTPGIPNDFGFDLGLLLVSEHNLTFTLTLYRLDALSRERSMPRADTIHYHLGESRSNHDSLCPLQHDLTILILFRKCTKSCIFCIPFSVGSLHPYPLLDI